MCWLTHAHMYNNPILWKDSWVLRYKKTEHVPFVYPIYCNWRRPFWGWNVFKLLIKKLYHVINAQVSIQRIPGRGNESLLYQFHSCCHPSSWLICAYSVTSPILPISLMYTHYFTLIANKVNAVVMFMDQFLLEWYQSHDLYTDINLL